MPIAPILFQYGVDRIAGLVALEEELIWEAAQEGKMMSIFKHGGAMVSIGSAVDSGMRMKPTKGQGHQTVAGECERRSI